MSYLAVTSQQLAREFGDHIHRATSPYRSDTPQWSWRAAPGWQPNEAAQGVGLLDAILARWGEQVASRRNLLQLPEPARPIRLGYPSAAGLPVPPAMLVDGIGDMPAFSQTCRDYLDRTVPDYLRPADAPEEDDGYSGMVAIDIDEAVHGSYAGVRDVDQIISQGFDSLVREYRLEADEWVAHPLVAMRHSVVPDGGADVAINAAVGAPLGLLAFVAMKAGIEEAKDARAQGQVLADAAGQVELDRAGLQALNAGHVGCNSLHPVRALIEAGLVLAIQQGRDLEIAQLQNRRSGKIGIASFISGTGIASKVVATVGMQAGLSIAAGGPSGATALTATNAVAATTATVVGTASTMVLSPLAAGGAIMLGASFARKSGSQRQEFRRRSEPMRAFLSAVRDAAAQRSHAPDLLRGYCEFVLGETRQRRRFYDVFTRSNRAFLAGASVYGSGAAGNTVMGGLMLANQASEASHPAVWGATTALSAVGGLIMAANSWQFLRGHHRQHRLDEYLHADDPELDRNFLSTVDMLADTLMPGNVASPGLELRAHFHRQLDCREVARQDLLRVAADGLGKFHPTPAGVHDTAQGPSRLQRLSATTWRRSAAVMRGVFQHGHLKQALREGRQARDDRTDRLRLSNLQAWLGDPWNAQPQAVFMLQSLQAQRLYLQEKVALRLDILNRSAPAAARGEPGAGSAASAGIGPLPHGAPEVRVAQTLSELLGRLDAGLERDQILLAETVLLEEQVRAVHGAGQPARPEQLVMLALAKERFLCLQKGYPYDPTRKFVNVASTDERFANYLLDEAPGRDVNLRGMLVDTEMQATEMRQLCHELAQNQFGFAHAHAHVPAPGAH
jgi:hypothetical protein